MATKSSTKKCPLPKPAKTLTKFLDKPEHSLCGVIVNHIEDEMLLLDRQGRIVFANDAAVKGLGCPRRKLYASRIIEFFKEKISLKRWQQNIFQELKEARKPSFYEIERVNHKGASQRIQVTAVYIEHDNLELILSIGRNITEQVNLQNQLKDVVDYYHMITEEAGDPIIIFDLEGQVTFVNHVAEEALGLTAKQFKGRGYKDIIAADHRHRFMQFFQKTLKSSPQRGVEIETVHTSGEKMPWEVTFSAIEKNQKVVAVHTISRDLRSRRQLQSLKIESEKLKAVQYFVSGMAMELRNPLLGVLKKSEDFLRKYKKKNFEFIGYREFMDMMRTMETIKNQLEYCYSNTDRLVKMNLKRVKMGKACCQVNPVIREALKLRMRCCCWTGKAVLSLRMTLR